MTTVHFRILCQLLRVPEEKVIQDFIDNVSMETTDSMNEFQTLAVLYFLQHGCAKGIYTKEDIFEMLSELQHLSKLYPPDYAELQAKEWKEMKYESWFKKWRRNH